MESFGHILRVEDNILKKVITAMIQKKHSLGGPQSRWKDTVEK